MAYQESELSSAYDAFESGAYDKAKLIFEKLEQQGFQRAHLYLGWMYDQGLGGTVNLDIAEHHFRSLSQANDVDGKYYLAALLQKKKSYVEAVRLYEEAAELGHVSAAYWAYAFNSGEQNFRVDKLKANYYLNKAVVLGHMFAKRDLARQEITSGKNILVRTRALFQYCFFKLKGIVLVLKNNEDVRVR